MTSRFRYSFYQDSRGNWRWRRARSGIQPLAYSEGFQNKLDCISNAKRDGYVEDRDRPLSDDPFADVRRPDPADQ